MISPAVLALADGSIFRGQSIGASGNTTGEVVFNTALTGYQEILTDPSYARQLITFTNPHIGNTGTTPEDMESGQVYAAGLIIRELSPITSSWRAEGSLSDFLKRSRVVAIADIDTRRLTRLLRERGAQAGCIMTGNKIDEAAAVRAATRFPGLKGMDLAKVVTTKEIYQWNDGTIARGADRPSMRAQQRLHVVAYDYGIKRNILRLLADQGCRITVVPAQTTAAEVLELKPDGIFLSNGPGDPEPCDYAIRAIEELLSTEIPVFGICLGHQLLALASGARTVKMKFGHHGANHPVQDLASGRVLISSQNHGFAVDESSLPENLKATHRSLFDGSLQGVARTDCAAFSFQGHPEASPGPHDVAPLFEAFTQSMLHRLQSQLRALRAAARKQAAEGCARAHFAMPKRTDIHSILIIGAGPIVIGQACEFDYSGAQACKALREEGYRVILVNSNPATIMTDPEMADAIYIEPINWRTIASIIEKEKPDALLPTMGGQTALNTALDLAREGVLEKFGVEMIAASRAAIDMAEDREQFRDAMREIGLATPQSQIARSLEEAIGVQANFGFPVVLRPSFTMGGSGGGIAYNREEFETIVARALEASPTHEVLIEESVIGWKEFEMEVVRDKADNCIIVCSIENLDPMGVHTGDSITIAPAQTLTDKEYQRMRDASIAVLRKIGVDTGGSNVQFAVNPHDGRLLVIEMNPRVSRSSALASKATGFPIAKIAAKLAVGYTLGELRNEITGGATPASFEPSIDYVVTKVPRFTFEKFPAANNRLTTQMKSVGEVMAIGRTLQESLHKALRGLETGLDGFDPLMTLPLTEEAATQLAYELRAPGADRLLYVADAMRAGWTLARIQELTGIDPWFLTQISDLIAEEARVRRDGEKTLTAGRLRELKRKGFSDRRLATLARSTEQQVRTRRREFGVVPVYKRVDTCAAEFATATAYLYSTYEEECEAEPDKRRKIMILGGGPNRIGQGIEFDYCCVHAALALREDGFETIMVNCNPETVSTDFDTSDRLYFEPLTLEDVLEIIHKERPEGVIVQFGGQTPLKLARALEAAGAPIIGTTPDSIDIAEDRERFQQLVKRLGLRQPANATARNEEQAVAHAREVGYPLVVRPSYVLGGRAMEIVFNEDDLRSYVNTAVKVSNDSPILLDRFLDVAVEVDVDAVCDGIDVLIGGIMEHVEQAGVHSGDSSCSLPPISLSPQIQEELREQTRKLAHGLQVVGLMNIQFAIQNGTIYLLEVNPRASRTVPFVGKATGMQIAKIAARVMTGRTLRELGVLEGRVPPYYSVKAAVFPFSKFPEADPILGPEMKSTGEVMGTGRTFGEAYAKSQTAAGVTLPRTGVCLISVRDRDKAGVVPLAQRLRARGFELVATSGTEAALTAAGIECRRANKVREGRPHIVDMIKNDEFDLIVNTTEGKQAILDSNSIRREAVHRGVTYYTTLAAAVATCEALDHIDEVSVNSLHDLHLEMRA